MKSGVDQITFIFWMNIQSWVINSYHVTRLERERLEKPKNITNLFQKRKYTADDDSETVEVAKEKRIRLEDSPPPTQSPPSPQAESDNQPGTSTAWLNSPVLNERVLIQILPAPWIRINGSLNRRVFDRYLGGILLHCVSFPGIIIKDVMKKFKFLYPVHLRHLLELLEEIECLKLWTLRKQKKTLLTSYAAPILERATILDNFEDTFVEVATDAVFKFSMFVGEKKYKVDFI